MRLLGLLYLVAALFLALASLSISGGSYDPRED